MAAGFLLSLGFKRAQGKSRSDFHSLASEVMLSPFLYAPLDVQVRSHTQEYENRKEATLGPFGRLAALKLL